MKIKIKSGEQPEQREQWVQRERGEKKKVGGAPSPPEADTAHAVGQLGK